MKKIHPLNIIFAVVTLALSASLILPLIVILLEFYTGNREESLLHEILTHNPHEYPDTKR